MASLTVTAANVQPTTTTTYKTGAAGAAITAGQSVYLDATTNTIKLADADLSVAAAKGVGIAINNAASGQPVTYAISGQINMGATLVKGTTYVVGATAGSVAPQADLTTGATICILGTAKDATYLDVNIRNYQDVTL